MIEKLKLINIQLLSAGIVVILLVVPLFPKLPLINVPKTFVAVRIEDFILAFFTLLALTILWQRRKELIQDNLSLAIIAFWIIGLFSTFSAIFVTKTVEPHLGFLHHLRRIEYMIPYFLIFAVKPSIYQVKDYLKILFLVSAIVVIYGVGQIYFDFPVFSTANREYAKGIPLTLGPAARVNSTFAGHYDLAAYTAVMLSIFAAFVVAVFGGLILKFGDLKKKLLGLVILVLAAGNLWLLLQTASRISFIAYLAGIIVTMFLLKKRFILILMLVVSLLSLLSTEELRGRLINTLFYGTKRLTTFQISPPAIFAFEIAQNTQTSTSTPDTSFQDVVGGEPENTQSLGVYRSARVRLDFEWPAAVNGFLRNPILGSGYSSLGVATDNDYLRSAGEVGIFGTFAFGLIFVEIGKRIKAFLKRTKEQNFEKTLVIGITGATCALLVNATFIDVFEASKIAILFWTLVGILAVTMKQSHASPSQNN